MKMFINFSRCPAGLDSRAFVPDDGHLNGAAGQRGST